jgi:hypothetical protein
MRRRRTFMRFLAPSALPIRPEQPLLGFACPSHVASSRLPCVSTLYSLGELPGVFSTRRAHGASPFRALPDGDRQRLSAGHPLLRLATDRDGIQACFLSHRPKIGRHKTSSSSKPTLSWVRPSWVCGAHCAFGAVGIACSAASLQGFHPSVGWGTPPPDFSTYGVPGSPGVHPPKGIPLARTLASRQRRRISRPGAAAPSVASASSRGDTRSASFGLAGKHPMRAPTLCSKFQRSGKLACLFSRLPALRGLCPPPRTRGFGRAVFDLLSISDWSGTSFT